MTLRLTVAHSIDALADRLAVELARPAADPFAEELVAVPADGIRSWLTARLSARLGDSGRGDGVVANVRFVFPSALVKRALGRATPSAAWSVGALTWTVHEVLRQHGERLGVRGDAVRCRAVADLFDRYALRRPQMVTAWERGADVDAVGAPLPPHARWQPELWRRVVARLGSPSDVAATALATAELAAGRLVPDPSLVPERVFLIGLAGLPDPHLRALAALSRQVDVHVLAPAPSLAVWDRLRVHTMARPITWPLPRDADETVSAGYHPLNETWGRAAREAHLALAATAFDVQAEIDVGTDAEPHPLGPDGEHSSLLARLQHDVRADRPPPGPPVGGGADARHRLRPDDASVQWHTCHGAARQAEVLRDIVLRLLQDVDADGRPRHQPRDIAVLCPDAAALAPAVEAAFLGDPVNGVPEIPLRVADRSLRQQNPLVDATVALLDLLDGRFRASQVLAFAERGPVARRFGFGPEHLETITAWVAATHIRWGSNHAAHVAAGLDEPLGAHTWRDGLDQLMVGAAVADPAMAAAAGSCAPGTIRFGPGLTVPAPDVEGDALVTAGALADLVDRLAEHVDGLSRPSTVERWCAALADATADLFEVADLDSWQRRDLDAEIEAFAAEAATASAAPAAGPRADLVAGPVAGPVAGTVPATELAALVADRLSERPGRVRFGTGAVTLSSLTAQRGVPHPVICLVGLDADMIGSGAAPADDLTQATPCVGDRDPRIELRAQLLDALLSAREHLVVISTGRDVRTNGRVPPIVPLAELTEVIDATASTDHPSGSATRSLTVEHPRQGWAEANFRPGALGVEGAWSFDRGGRDAAIIRRGQRDPAPFLAHPLPTVEPSEVSLDALARTLKNPAETLVRGRLGVTTTDERDPISDLVPLDPSNLEAWALAQSLLTARLAAADRWTDADLRRWLGVQRRTGAIPPLARGDRAVATAAALVDRLLELHDAHCGDARSVEPERLDVSTVVDPAVLGAEATWHEPVVVNGVVAGVRGNLVVDVAASRLRPGALLGGWVRAAALTLARPDCEWEVVQIGRAGSGDAVAARRIRMRSPAAAREALALAVDLHVRAMRAVVPAFPHTTHELHYAGADAAAAKAWGNFLGFGERDDRWIRIAVGTVELADLLAEPAGADERWGEGPSRIEQWASRIWTTVDRTATIGDVVPERTGA